MRYRVGRVRSATHIHVFIGRKAHSHRLFVGRKARNNTFVKIDSFLVGHKQAGDCLFIGRKAHIDTFTKTESFLSVTNKQAMPVQEILNDN